MDLNEVLPLLGRKRHDEIAGFGKVKFFDNSPGKLFGFVAGEKGDVFIHASRALEFQAGDSDLPIIVKAEFIPPDTLADFPRKGDTVIYIAEACAKGFRARKWVKWNEDDFTAIIQSLDERPTYRLIERRGHRIQSPLSKSENDGFYQHWIGRNLSELRQNFNMNDYPVFEEDDRAWYFETLINEEWETCDDPR